MSDALWQTVGIAAALAGFATSVIAAALGAFFVFYLRDKSKSRYDETHRRAEISEMRKSYEEQMKNLTLQLTATDQRWREVNHLLLSSQNLEAAPSSVQRNEFLKSMGIAENELEIDAKLVLMLTPFSPTFEESYNAVVDTCRSVGLNCVRGDEEDAHGEILTHIIRIMVRSRVVIANIGSRNPNVYYELGIAHALGKPTILISETLSDLPFDVQSKRILVYKDVDELKKLLPAMLARTLASQPKSPSVQAVEQTKKGNRRPFPYKEAADGLGALRNVNEYLCISNDGEAIFTARGPYIFIRLTPVFERPAMGEVETYRIAQAHLRPMQGTRGSSWSSARHESGAVVFYSDPSNRKIALDASELYLTGELWSNDFYFLDPTRDRVKELGFSFVPTGAVEEVMLDTLKNFIAIARDHLKIELPMTLDAGLAGVHNFRLAVQPEYFGFSQFEGRILRNFVRHQSTLNDWSKSPVELLMPLFENIYDAAGLKRPSAPVPTRKA